MLTKLIKLANRLDELELYDLASELDEICREAAAWIDRRPESERSKDLTGPERMELAMEEDLPLVEKELKSRPGEKDPRRWLIDEEGTHKEDRSEPVPEEKLKKLFPGKTDKRDPDELSEEDLSDQYLETRVEDIEDFRDPERDILVEHLEDMKNTQNEWED